MKKLFYNATFRTMDGTRIAKNMLVEDDRIAAIDCDASVCESDPDCRMIDLGGRTVLPGLHDSHQHFLCYAIDKEKIDFYHAKSVQDMAELTRRYIEERNIPKGEWIQGGGWNENFFDVKHVPTRQQLDEMAPDHPVMFTRACCSTAVANTAALKLAGIFEHPPAMDDGEVVVDEHGVPTGLLNERARFRVYDIIPKISKDEVKQLILDYQDDLLAAGLSTVQTDDFKLWDATFQDILQAYNELNEAGLLKVRFIQQLRLVDHEQLDAYLSMGIGPYEGTGKFKVGTYKLLPDGSLGGKTASLLEPYEGDEDNRGILTYTREELYSLLEKAHTNGLQLAMHAIGDGAMDLVLSCYEELQEKYPREDPRYRIIHCQVTSEDILNRFARQDVIADIQPLFIKADMEVAEELIGSDRLRTSYNWKTMLDKGIHISGSSDAPVESFDPRLAIYCAVTSKNLEGHPPGGWMPEQRLSRQEAVSLYTSFPAYTCYEEENKGMLKQGFLADFIVMPEDIMTVPEQEIQTMAIDEVWVGGEKMYEA